MPDGLALPLVLELLGLAPDDTTAEFANESEATQTGLVVGSRGGTIRAAAEAVLDQYRQLPALKLTEVEPTGTGHFGQISNRWLKPTTEQHGRVTVVGRHRSVDTLPATARYDWVVIHLPAPGIGPATQSHDGYLGPIPEQEIEAIRLTVPTGTQAGLGHVMPGRLGPSRWAEAVASQVGEAVTRVRQGGTVAILLPEQARQHRAGEYGVEYVPWELLQGLALKLAIQAGLQDVRCWIVTEKNTVNQPWAESRRPTWTLVLARRAQ